ncbi:MAG: ribosome maturation factor RimM [Pedococcus sp.]
MSATDQLLVARIGKPHGLNGEVTVQAHTDDPERRFVPGVVFATQAPAGSGVPKSLTLATARLHREIWLLGFEQVPDRTGAEGLRGTRLFLALDDVLDDVDDGDGWYEEELVGLAVVDTAGATLGEVTGLETGAAQDLLVVALTGGGQALVPFVEAIVPEVDTEAGRVVIDPPPGLLELADE